MSNENILMTSLLKRQEQERMVLAAGAYKAWQAVKENEQALLGRSNGKYEEAVAEVKKEIDKRRDKYFNEWGADGKLAALMTARHEKERERLVKRQQIFDRPEKIRNDRDEFSM